MRRRLIKDLTIFIALLIAFLIGGCKKQDDWLNAKRYIGDVTPKTLSDYQALMDNSVKTNNIFSCAGLLGTDNLYVSDEQYSGLQQFQEYLYTFNKEIWTGGKSQDWNNQYEIMEIANIVLDGLKNQNKKDPDYDNIKGQALYLRATTLFTLAQLFCKPYNIATANKDLGIPVRLTPDVNTLYPRGTLEEVYTQIIKDDSAAATLLKVDQLYRRPSRLAAYGLMARIRLVMGNYEQAKQNANNAISGGAILLDYNNSDLVKPAATYPFPSQGVNNPEILYFAYCQYYQATQASVNAKGHVSPDLYRQYDNNDIRKRAYYRFSGTDTVPHFIGSYTGSIGTFCGIATNELYLVRAECYAREGNAELAMKDLNTLLEKRYISGTFSPLTAADKNAALEMILKERRKELPFTENIRWEDLRRLNLEPDYQVTVHHIINGITYTMLPNDPKYVLPIPDNEIQLSNIQQNDRE